MEIFDKYRSSNEDGSETESGEDRRLGGGSSLDGSSAAGTEAAATRRQADRGSARPIITTLAETDDEDDSALPPYDGADAIHHSIEDEGVSMNDGYQQLGTKSLNLTQDWSFNGLGGSGGEDSAGADCGSDEAQLDSSGDEHGPSHGFDDTDIEMKTGDTDDALPDPTAPTSTSTNGVISVPAPSGSDRNSEEVAEIHLDSNKGTKVE